ncbi:MAG TPA: restriction endonuclease [Roseiflexaceae bacterium]|nr:restriction endonuclease [Roseiflexaceae bacterium]
MTPPHNPDPRRRLKGRLLALSPRAFELFAGDLLVFVGLQNVAVTRASGDGGIDAHGDLVAESGLVRVRAGVQVKRHQHNIRRPEIDRFIGALGGGYDRGVFITTAGYAPSARQRAAGAPLLRVDLIDGDQVVGLMRRHSLGLRAGDADLDEDYFLGFEAQVEAARLMRDARAPYSVAGEEEQAGTPIAPEQDLISLRALSYLVRADMQTVRRGWVETGRLAPDSVRQVGAREAYFFRRDRVEEIRALLARGPLPAGGAEWRQEFLDFARSHNLTKSYKPVLLLALLALVDRDGAAPLDALARVFLDFYLDRQRRGLPPELDGPLAQPERVSLADARLLIVKYPLDRFRIKGFLELSPADGLVRFHPPLWRELRAYELLDVKRSAEEQVEYYFGRQG